MERVHVDVAHYKSQRFLVFVDAASRWIDVQPRKDSSTTSVIDSLRHTLKYVGLPRVIVTDNGTNFVSTAFEKNLGQIFF